MSPASLKAFAANVIVVSSIVAASWTFVLRPMKERLAELRVEHKQQLQEVAEFETAQGQRPESGSEALERIGAERDALVERLRVSTNASAMYDALRELAKAYSVEIERIEPIRGGRTANTGAVAISQSGHTIKLGGTYRAVAEFVQAVQTDVGMTKVTSLRLMPSPEPVRPPRVEAQIEAIHFGLEGKLGEGDG